MTVQTLLTETQKAGITLIPNGDRLRVLAPVGALTTELRAALAIHKAVVLHVISRLEGMRANEGKVPIPCAVLEAKGGPGRCFSCGEALEHPAAYGRCTACGLAAELFHAAKRDDTAGEVAV